MGFYNLKEIVAGYQSGKLAQMINQYDQNDLVLISRELEQYLKKINQFEENKGLIEELAKKIEEMH